jgi:flagellar motor switch protein FliN/FliY
MAENENEDGVEVSDLTPEELEAVGDTDTSTDTGEVPEGDAADGGGDMAVDEDMLADMLDQASDAPEGDDGMAVDDDMLADMLDQASDAPEGDDGMAVDDDMLADMLDQASDDAVVDDDMLADMLDQASDDAPKEQALDSEGNPMDDDMAAMWGDALGAQAAGETEFAGGKIANESNVDYQKVEMPELITEHGGKLNLDIIMDVPITISMEVGRTQSPIRNLLQLNQGSVIELDRLAGESLDVLVNGCLIAHGEVVVVNEKFGIRLTDIISVDERVKKLTG